MSEALIGSLQKRIDDLTGENATLKSESKDRRIANRKLKADLEALTSERDGAVKERDGLKTSATSAPSEWQAKYEALRSKVVERDHRDAFKRLASEAKVRPEAIDDLYALSGYKAEGDVDDARITGLIGEAVKARPYLAQPAETATTAPGGAQQPITVGRGSAGPGGGKGVNEQKAPGALAQIDAAHGSRPAGRIA